MTTIEQWAKYAIQEWEAKLPTHEWIDVLPEGDPSLYMDLLPPEMRAAIAGYDLVRKPPATLDDFWYLESTLYSAKAFEGYTDAQRKQKIEEDKRQRKQRKFDRFWALHNYLVRHSQLPSNTSLERTRD